MIVANLLIFDLLDVKFYKNMVRVSQRTLGYFFYKKINLATKTLRHKGKMRSIFATSCLCALVASHIFCSKAEKN
jgi:hypothetical protein